MPVNFQTLGPWDDKGVPDYLASPIYVEPATMERLRNAVSSHKPLDPAFVAVNATRNLYLTASADVYVTFVDEGAGFKNALVFYTYPIDPAANQFLPTSRSQWNDTYTIVFPKASRLRNGGSLSAGMRVHLGTFPANTGIGFALVSNGWRESSKTVDPEAELIFTDAPFNTDNGYVQSILLRDALTGQHYICFEDNMFPSADGDYNDVCFAADAVPSTAILPTATVLPTLSVDAGRLLANSSGLQVVLTNDQIQHLQSSGQPDHTFEVALRFQTPHLTGHQRTILRNAMNALTWNNGVGIAQEEANVLTKTCRFNYADVVASQYLEILKTSQNQGEEAQFKELMVFEQLAITDNAITTVSITNVDTTEEVETLSSTNFETQAPRLFGDPHIRTIYGQTYNFPNDPGIYVLCHSPQVEVRGLMEKAPEYAHSPYAAYREATFLSKVAVWIRNRWYVTIDIRTQVVEGEHDAADVFLNAPSSVMRAEYGPETRVLYLHLENFGLVDVRGVEVAYVPHIEGHLSEVRLDLKAHRFTEMNGALISCDYVHQRAALAN